MLERILTYVLIPALIMFTVPQLGAQFDREKAQGASSYSAVEQMALRLLDGSLLRTSTRENEFFALTRNAPDKVMTEETFTVEDEIKAKVDLDFAAISAELPSGFRVVRGELLAFERDLTAGETFTNSYEVRAPSEPGTFTLEATARGKPPAETSQALSANLTIDVESTNQTPNVRFSFSPQEPRAGQRVTFDASNSEDPDGSIANYRWNFGDGETTSGAAMVTVTHSYEEAGTYRVTLIIEDNEGAQGRQTELVTVEQAPTVFGQIPREVLIGAGVIVGAGAAFILGRALIGAIAGPGAPPAAQIREDAQAFINRTALPLQGVTSVETEEQVESLTRAKWVRTLFEAALITSVADGQLNTQPLGELSRAERNQLDPGRIGEESLLGFVSERVEPGDRIVRLTWETEAGGEIESLAVVGPDGEIKLDTLMSFESL